MSKIQFCNVTAFLFGSNNNGWAKMMSAVVAGINGVSVNKPVRLTELTGSSYVGQGICALTQLINLFVDRSVNYERFDAEVITSDAVAIRAYSIMKHLKAGLTPAKVADAVVKDADGAEDRKEFKALAEALKEAQSAGIRLRISRLSQEHSYALEVPEGVELAEGDKIKFDNGVADNGIKLAYGVRSSYEYTVVKVNDELKALRPKNTPNARHRMTCINNTMNLIREIKATEVSEADLI